jgi:hypothetical protein
VGKLLKAVREFGSYLRANAGRIPNYGKRRRAGEAISTAFTESVVNQVISKRMVKKQQMRWTSRGAHLLLQIRTRVLNDQLADDFHRWYPNFSRALDPGARGVASPNLTRSWLSRRPSRGTGGRNSEFGIRRGVRHPAPHLSHNQLWLSGIGC